MNKKTWNIDKWRVKRSKNGNWLLYPPGTGVPYDLATTWEWALRFFPQSAKNYEERKR